MPKMQPLSEIDFQLNLNAPSYNFKSHLRSSGERIGRRFGRVFYRYDAKTGDLYYKTLSIFGRILRLFGYCRNYNKNDLGKWLAKYNIGVPSTSLGQATTQVSQRVLQKQMKAAVRFRLMCEERRAVDQNKIISELKSSSLNVNCLLDEKGTTPLHLASANGLLKVVESLIEQGANINAQLNEKAVLKGRTPVYLALFDKHGLTVEKLLEKRADVNVGEGWSLLRQAIYQHYVNQLYNENYFISGNPKKIIKTILEKNADVNHICDGFSLLEFAIINGGDKEVIEWLIEKGADCTRKTNDDKTMVELAKIMHQDEIVELLEAQNNR